MKKNHRIIILSLACFIFSGCSKDARIDELHQEHVSVQTFQQEYGYELQMADDPAKDPAVLRAIKECMGTPSSCPFSKK